MYSCTKSCNVIDSQVCNTHRAVQSQHFTKKTSVNAIANPMNGHDHWDKNGDLWFILPLWLVITHGTHSSVGKGLGTFLENLGFSS